MMAGCIEVPLPRWWQYFCSLIGHHGASRLEFQEDGFRCCWPWDLSCGSRKEDEGGLMPAWDLPEESQGCMRAGTLHSHGSEA